MRGLQQLHTSAAGCVNCPQVRALQSTPFKAEDDAFSAMAAASLGLCRAYQGSVAAGQGGLSELSAARMHLRGLLKQCEAAFEDHVLYKQLQDMLEEILALEDQAIANRNTRTAVVQ